MAKFEMRGMAAYLRQLEKLGASSTKICKTVVYAGADLVADAIKQELRGLRWVSDAEALAAWQRRTPTYISVSQKIGLVKSFGVAPITNRYGVISTKLGFDGYNDVETRRWPNGQPNALIARACESGNVAMLKQPFMRPAQTKAKAPALDAMKKTADAELKKIVGGNT